MVAGTRVTTNQAESTAKAVTCGPTEVGILAFGMKTRFMARVNTSGSTAAVTRATGSITIWTATEFTFGKTEDDTRVATLKTRKTALALIPGRMAVSM